MALRAWARASKELPAAGPTSSTISGASSRMTMSGGRLVVDDFPVGCSSRRETAESPRLTGMEEIGECALGDDTEPGDDGGAPLGEGARMLSIARTPSSSAAIWRRCWRSFL